MAMSMYVDCIVYVTMNQACQCMFSTEISSTSKPRTEQTRILRGMLVTHTQNLHDNNVLLHF